MIDDEEIYGRRAVNLNMNNDILLGNSKEYMINSSTRITYNDYMMIIDFNLGSFKQSSYLLNKTELVRTEDLLAIYTLNLPKEIKRKIINHIETDNLKHNIIMLTIEQGIDIALAYIEHESREIGPSYINYVENSDNEELEI